MNKVECTDLYIVGKDLVLDPGVEGARAHLRVLTPLLPEIIEQMKLRASFQHSVNLAPSGTIIPKSCT